MGEALLSPEGHLGHVVVVGARHEDADQRGQDGDSGIAGDDDDRMNADTRDVRIPDVATLDQRSSLARHAAAANREMAATSSSCCESGWW